MKISDKRDDFSNAKGVTLHAGCCCCCCCCIFWPGGIIGGALGILPTQADIATFADDPAKKAALSISRKWFWLTFLALMLVTGLFYLFHEYKLMYSSREGILIFVMTSTVSFPLLHLFISALVTANALKTKVPDKSIRQILNRRNIYIVAASFLGYLIGWGLTVAMFSKF